MRYLRPALVSVLLALAAVPSVAVAAPAAPSSRAATTIDFSAASVGPFDQRFFAHEGIIFTEGTFVSFIQGDEALASGDGQRIAGDVRGGFASVSAEVAPANQGTATYTLAAYKKGNLLGSTSITVTQDEGDPTTGPPGYFTISLGPLPKAATSFSLSNVFVRSSFPETIRIEVGVASMTFSR
jgi:hypothetical protein